MFPTIVFIEVRAVFFLHILSKPSPNVVVIELSDSSDYSII